ncbi:RNA polymerase sigma factor [Nanoarchaeota archaeon]
MSNLGKSSLKSSDFVKEGSKTKDIEGVFDLLLNLMKEKGMTMQELIAKYEGSPKEIFVPLSIFSTKLSPSESLSVYLKEEQDLSYSEIGELLNRNERSIWTNFHNARKKAKERLPLDSEISAPLSIFKTRQLSIFESLILYLRDTLKLKNSKIAHALNKHTSVTYTVYNRAKQKLDSKNKKIK